MQTRLILTITHKAPIPDLTDKVANRVWQMQGVEGADAALDDLVKFLDEEPKLEQPTEASAAMGAQGEASYWAEVIGMFVERLNHGPQTTAASDVLALLSDCQYLASLSHPQPTEPAPSTAGERAKVLSGTQQWALEWFKENGPATRSQYRNAGIASKTLNSLVRAGLIERKTIQEPWWVGFALTNQGEAE